MKNKLLLSALLTFLIMPITKPSNDALKIGVIATCSTLRPVASTGQMYYGFSSFIHLLLLQPYPCVRDFVISGICAGVEDTLKNSEKLNMSVVSEDNKSLAEAAGSFGWTAGAGTSIYWLLGGFENKRNLIQPTPMEDYMVLNVWPPSVAIISQRR